MNIFDALKAANGQEWIYRKSNECRQILVTKEDRVDLSLEELLADDWEVAEREVMVSRSKFDEIWVKALAESTGKPHLLRLLILTDLGLVGRQP